MSSSASIPAMLLSSALSNGASSSLSRGSTAAQFESERRSRPPAVPYTARPTSRCMSVISRSTAISSPRATLFEYSSFTAVRRRFIATADNSGLSTHERSMRPPIGVLVLSSTHSSEPFFSPLRRDSVSSRLRRVTQSSSMYRPP